ncbi:MAG TPA: energy-coupling factor transporter transmembrane component T [Thermodesulfobacteriota bacterium]|nr:energy-coupling factor transporter transmembrane component T [Thermodesulfobacteriota bacterium]
MDVSSIDYYANHGTSFLHRARAFSKIVFAALVIASVVVSSSFYTLLAVYISLLSLAVWTRLPVFKIVTIAAYPAIFAVIFAAASWNGSWMNAGIIVLKALSASLAMVILIVTTPYPDVFSCIGPVLPDIVTEGLFLTYRSLFILLELTDNLIKGLRVRGGLTHGRYARNVVNFSSGIGLLLVRGFDLSEKFYGVLKIRGYSGRLSGGVRNGKVGFDEITAIAAGVLIFAAAIAVKTEGEFSAYEIYIPAVSFLILIVSIAYALFSESRGVVWKR